MKDEIKEILEWLEFRKNYGAEIDEDDLKSLLDYITNLQDRTKELEQINEEHRKINGELREVINEAIEYMNDPDNFLCINVEEQGRVLMDEESQNDLLNILQGEQNE